MITLNREDFISLHKQGQKHSGIIICKEDRDFKKQSEIINEFTIQNTQPLIGRLVRIKKQNEKGSSTQVFVIQEY